MEAYLQKGLGQEESAHLSIEMAPLLVEKELQDEIPKWEIYYYAKREEKILIVDAL